MERTVQAEWRRERRGADLVCTHVPTGRTVVHAGVLADGGRSSRALEVRSVRQQLAGPRPPVSLAESAALWASHQVMQAQLRAAERRARAARAWDGAR